MASKQKLMRGAAVGLLAAGVGLMAVQNGLLGGAVHGSETGESEQAGFSAVPAAPGLPEIPTRADVRLPRQAPAGPAAMPVSMPAVAGTIQTISLPQTDEAKPGDELPAPMPVAESEFGLPCGLSISASPMPAAMVALDIMDPCQPETEVTIAHGEFRVTGHTDAMGLLTLDVPAFETPAFFTAATPDGQTQATLVGLPDLDDYDRVAVQWEGDRQLELHAMELGAEFGGQGHIWEQAPGRVDDATHGDGGFLTEIGVVDGDNGMAAQIYTFPRRGLGAGDSVRFSVDAPVTDGNCGRTVAAQALQIGPGGPVQNTPITMTMPDCDAVGDYILLQNLFQDLRLASN